MVVRIAATINYFKAHLLKALGRNKTSWKDIFNSFKLFIFHYVLLIFMKIRVIFEEWYTKYPLLNLRIFNNNNSNYEYKMNSTYYVPVDLDSIVL